MIRRHLWSLGAAAGLAALMATEAWAQPKAYCPSGTQAKWAGGVFRCEKLTIVASALPSNCATNTYACKQGTGFSAWNDGVKTVVGGPDVCRYFCAQSESRAGGWPLVGGKTFYPTCPTGLSMAQDAGPNGQDLCIATSPSWVQPLLAAN